VRATVTSRDWRAGSEGSNELLFTERKMSTCRHAE
jgi:hypothetical protein